MKTRYDYMKESSVRDTEDGAFYPDVLTLNLNTFTATEALIPIELTDIDIDKFWWTVQKQYGTAELDDIVLTLNGVTHRNFLEEGQIIFIPAKRDIESSFGAKE